MILDKLFQLMADKQASDIFISAGAAIHIKIGGVSMPVNQQVMVPEMIEKMAYELLTPAQIQVFEEKLEMNLSVGIPSVGNYRINIFRQRGAVAMVVRYIPATIPALSELGVPAVLPELIMEKRGLILVVGSTGSGKSTTIAAMLDHRNTHYSGHILTVEDPVEFLFTHKKSIVNQREIGLDTLDWNSALKSAMRQAPDCILIGEIRDKETMQAAIAYARPATSASPRCTPTTATTRSTASSASSRWRTGRRCFSTSRSRSRRTFPNAWSSSRTASVRRHAKCCSTPATFPN